MGCRLLLKREFVEKQNINEINKYIQLKTFLNLISISRTTAFYLEAFKLILY
jgi:hypothetical protein